MSTKTAELPERAEEATSASEPVLSDEIQRHLGNLLAAAYAQDDAELSATSRFAELLAKLDLALGEAAGRNDAEFKKLLVAAVPALRRFAVSLARDPTAADDLVQDTLLRAWRARAHFDLGTNFEAWTFTILRNAFYSSQHKPREVQDDDGSYAARLASPPDQAGRLDLQDVRAALDRLAPVMREALVPQMSLDTYGKRVDHARIKKNLTQTKLAADMGISLKALRAYIQDTSKPQIHRLKKLAELLDVSESWLIDGTEIDPNAPLFSEAEEDEQIELARAIYAKRRNVPVERVRMICLD